MSTVDEVDKEHKLKRILAVFVLFLGLVATTASVMAANREGKTKADHQQLAQVRVPASALAGFADLLVDDWKDGWTRVLSNLEPDDLGGDNSGTDEWSITGSMQTCAQREGRANPYSVLFHEHYINTRVYGPRALVFPTSPPGGMVPILASVTLVHNGPTPTQHAIDFGFSGYHKIACVDLIGTTTTTENITTTTEVSPTTTSTSTMTVPPSTTTSTLVEETTSTTNTTVVQESMPDEEEQEPVASVTTLQIEEP